MSGFLILNEVSKQYDSIYILNNITLNIDKGEFITIQGPSGAGKTTLLGIIGGLERPTSGIVLFMGKDIYRFNDKELSAFRNRHIGFIFQSYNLIPFLTALENVILPLIIAGSYEADAKKKAVALLEQVGLGDKVDRLPRELSGGEQQRVAICRALISDPLMILADEPTANLDEDNENIVMELLREISKIGKTVILATHNRKLSSYATRVYYLDGGVLRSGV